MNDPVAPAEENLDDIQSVVDQKNKKKQALGRGLDALFSDGEVADEQAHLDTHHSQSDMPMGGVVLMPVSFMSPNKHQPRKVFDEDALSDLSSSIKKYGILQPLVVRPLNPEDDQFELVAGERRWRAAQLAGLHEVPVIIQDLDNKASAEIALIENIQREDLSPIEEATAYQRLIDEFDYTQAELAKSVGKSRSHITNTLRLLNLPQQVQDMVVEGGLTAGHARTLLTAKNPDALLEDIIDQGLSVRAAEEKAAAQTGHKPGERKPRKNKPLSQKTDTENDDVSHETDAAGTVKDTSPKAKKNPDILALEEDLSGLLGMRIEIDGKGQSGRLIFHYENLDQFDDILQRISSSL